MARTPSKRRGLLLGLAAAAIIVVSSACSSSEEGTAEVASLEADGASLQDAAEAATLDDASSSGELAPDEAALEFSQCMREQGLDFPDLSVDADGNIELREAFQSLDRDQDGFQAATEACGDILAQTGFGGGRRQAAESTEVQDAMVEFSQCVRDSGYDVGDLTLGGGPGPGAGGDGGGAGEGAGGGGQGQQGQRQQGFGDRNARFADALGLDYEDPGVQEAIDGCATVVDEAFAAAGIGQGGS